MAATAPRSLAWLPRVESGPRLSAIAGGTAYDGRQGGVWISDGRRLALVRADSASGLAACDLICTSQSAPMPPTPTTSTVVTGLTFIEAGKMPKPGVPAAQGVLFLSYSNGYVAAAALKGMHPCRSRSFATWVRLSAIDARSVPWLRTTPAASSSSVPPPRIRLPPPTWSTSCPWTIPVPPSASSPSWSTRPTARSCAWGRSPA